MGTYLVPDADVTLVSLISSVEIGALDEVPAEEFSQVLALLVEETLDMGQALGAHIYRERFVPSGLGKVVSMLHIRHGHSAPRIFRFTCWLFVDKWVAQFDICFFFFFFFFF